MRNLAFIFTRVTFELKSISDQIQDGGRRPNLNFKFFGSLNQPVGLLGGLH